MLRQRPRRIWLAWGCTLQNIWLAMIVRSTTLSNVFPRRMARSLICVRDAVTWLRSWHAGSGSQSSPPTLARVCCSVTTNG
ncbi:MAG: hypothetical protein ACE5R6_07600 [Candidatus Heimdallarchaeota archaeon]